MMQVLSGTAITTGVSYSIDSVLLQLLTPGAMTFIPNPARDPVAGGVLGWNVIPKPHLVSACGAALQLLTIFLAARALRTARDTFRRAAIWAAALTCLALVGPVGWSYYYIAPAAFLPLLIVWYGPLRGAVILTVLLGAISVPTLALDLPSSGAVPAQQLAGVVAMIVMGVLFARAGLAAKRADPP
jgi:alpha-1,2-mannosyltransferase